MFDHSENTDHCLKYIFCLSDLKEHTHKFRQEVHIWKDTHLFEKSQFWILYNGSFEIDDFKDLILLVY